MEEKKNIIVYTLKILETETDADHPITQTEITNAISQIIPCDRKTIGRNIMALKNIGYPIIKTSKGFYMTKKIFNKDELDFIIQAIKASPLKNSEEKEILAEKTLKALIKFYKW